MTTKDQAIAPKLEFLLDGARVKLYFASSEADGGSALWWMEKAKRALMEISE